LPARAFGVVGEKDHGQWGTAPPQPTGYRLLCCYCAAAGKGTTTLRRLTGVRPPSGARTAGKRARGAPPLVCAAEPSCFGGEMEQVAKGKVEKEKGAGTPSPASRHGPRAREVHPPCRRQRTKRARGGACLRTPAAHAREQPPQTPERKGGGRSRAEERSP
jgi:hypothetical protein